MARDSNCPQKLSHSFCPTLVIISNTLGLSENLAGVTLIAFGNGSPDLFSAFANTEADTELMFNELIGASLFIIGIVGSLIVLVRPFSVVVLMTSRDLLFFLMATLAIYIAFYDEVVNVYEAVAILTLYVLYLVFAVTHHFYTRHKQKKADRLAAAKRAADLAAGLEVEPEEVPEAKPPPTETLCQQFGRSINPIDMEDWREGGRCGRVCAVLKVPIKLFLAVIIPCTDEDKPLHGWSRLLNSMQILTTPLLLLAIKGCELWRRDRTAFKY